MNWRYVFWSQHRAQRLEMLGHHQSASDITWWKQRRISACAETQVGLRLCCLQSRRQVFSCRGPISLVFLHTIRLLIICFQIRNDSLYMTLKSHSRPCLFLDIAMMAQNAYDQSIVLDVNSMTTKFSDWVILSSWIR